MVSVDSLQQEEQDIVKEQHTPRNSHSSGGGGSIRRQVSDLGMEDPVLVVEGTGKPRRGGKKNQDEKKTADSDVSTCGNHNGNDKGEEEEDAELDLNDLISMMSGQRSAAATTAASSLSNMSMAGGSRTGSMALRAMQDSFSGTGSFNTPGSFSTYNNDSSIGDDLSIPGGAAAGGESSCLAAPTNAPTMSPSTSARGTRKLPARVGSGYVRGNQDRETRGLPVRRVSRNKNNHNNVALAAALREKRRNGSSAAASSSTELVLQQQQQQRTAS